MPLGTRHEMQMNEEGQMGTGANWTVRASAQGAATIQIQLTVALGSLGSA